MRRRRQSQHRTLPHSLDAERAILGSILLHSDVFNVASVALRAGDFFRDAHRRIFEHMGKLAERNVTIDFVTLRESLTRVGDIDEVGGPVYISGLTDGLPRSMNLKHHAAIVREKSRLRALIYASNKLAASAYEAEDDASAIAEVALKEFASALTSSSSGPTRIDKAVSDYVDALDHGSLVQPIATGLIDLDLIAGGVRPKDLTIIAARPSVGKTSLAMGLAEYMAREGYPAAYFSLKDESIEAMAARALSMRARVQKSAIERKTASADEWGRFGEAMGSFGDVPLFVDDSSRTFVEVAAWCRRLKTEHALSVAFIDYIQLLAPEQRGRSREEEIAAISTALKLLARELDIAIVALSQLKRASEERRDKRPHLSDLRESGALEQDADLALLIFREEMHSPKPDNAGIAECIIAKQRHGPTGVIKLAFDKMSSSFRNLAQF